MYRYRFIHAISIKVRRFYKLLTEGSKEMIRTVLSANPTAKNLDLCSPEGTLAKAIQITSADISFLSVYSFNCPDCDNKVNMNKVTHKSPDSLVSGKSYLYSVGESVPLRVIHGYITNSS